MPLKYPTCWVLGSSPTGRLISEFVSRGQMSVAWDWDGVGDLADAADPQIYTTLEAAGRRKPADDLRDLRIFTDRMVAGDVVVVLDRSADDVVFGELTGEYDYNPGGGDHRHTRRVRWFGRLATTKVDDVLLRSVSSRQLVRRLPEQLHWQRLAGEVDDFLGRPPTDVPVTARKAAAARTGRTRTTTPRVTAPPKVLTPDKLCPSCGLLRAPSMFPDGDAFCRDCA